MLTDKHQLLHAVAILWVPILLKLRIHRHHIFQLVLRHRGIPLSYITQRHLAACLFEDVARIFLALEVADALGTDDALRPLASHEFVEQSEVQRPTGIIDKRADAVLLRLALIVMVVVMMVMFMLVLVFMFMMVMFVLIVVIIIVVIIVVVVTFYLLNPGGRGSHFVEVKLLGMNQTVEVNVAVVALDDIGLGLNGTDNLAHLAQLLLRHF